MQVALHTWSLRDRFKDPTFDLDQAIRLAADWGFAALEVMSGKAGSPAEHFGSEEPARLRRLAELARARGVPIVCVSTYNDFAFTPNEAWRLDNIAYVQRWLRIAQDLGVPNLRLLSGYYPGEQDRAAIDALVEAGIRECAAVAETTGVNMALENHSSVFFGAEEIVALIGRIGSPRLTTCPDPTNWVGPSFFEPDGPRQPREAMFASVARIAPLATQSHLKVAGVGPDGALVGWGGDLARLLRLYRDSGYDGCIAFESIAPGDLLAPLPRAREIVAAAIAAA